MKTSTVTKCCFFFALGAILTVTIGVTWEYWHIIERPAKVYSDGYEITPGDRVSFTLHDKEVKEGMVARIEKDKVVIFCSGGYRRVEWENVWDSQIDKGQNYGSVIKRIEYFTPPPKTVDVHADCRKRLDEYYAGWWEAVEGRRELATENYHLQQEVEALVKINSALKALLRDPPTEQEFNLAKKQMDSNNESKD